VTGLSACSMLFQRYVGNQHSFLGLLLNGGLRFESFFVPVIECFSLFDFAVFAKQLVAVGEMDVAFASVSMLQQWNTNETISSPSVSIYKDLFNQGRINTNSTRRAYQQFNHSLEQPSNHGYWEDSNVTFMDINLAFREASSEDILSALDRGNCSNDQCQLELVKDQSLSTLWGALLFPIEFFIGWLFLVTDRQSFMKSCCGPLWTRILSPCLRIFLVIGTTAYSAVFLMYGLNSDMLYPSKPWNAHFTRKGDITIKWQGEGVSRFRLLVDRADLMKTNSEFCYLVLLEVGIAYGLELLQLTLMFIFEPRCRHADYQGPFLRREGYHSASAINGCDCKEICLYIISAVLMGVLGYLMDARLPEFVEVSFGYLSWIALILLAVFLKVLGNGEKAEDASNDNSDKSVQSVVKAPTGNKMVL
jgi:hypothetical protein